MPELNVKPRMELVDALRGFALMGLFLVHMVEFFELHWYSPKPSAVFDTVMWMFGAKAYAMFAMLFGLSFFIIMNNQAARGVDFRARFTWRLLLLFTFGYLHSLFYNGDILQVLAISGLILFFACSLSNKYILLLAAFFLLQIPAITYFIFLMFNPELAAGIPVHWEIMGRVFEVFANGSFFEVLKTNALQSHLGKWMFFIESGRLWNILGLVLLGMWLGRIHFFSDVKRHTRLAVIGITSFLCLALLMYFARIYFSQNPVGSPLSQWLLKQIVSSYMNTALMMAGVLFFVVSYQVNLLQRLLKMLVPCGRMTLTLYVAQGVIGVPLFFNYGLGWYNTMDHASSLILGITFWAGQVVFARWWFRSFQYGPLEWLWRAATYTRMDIPFKSPARFGTKQPAQVYSG